VSRPEGGEAAPLTLGLVDLPGADLGGNRIRREQEDDRVGRLDQAGQALRQGSPGAMSS
jgi:hypothetical protein